MLIKGINETIWKSQKYKLQVIASVQGYDVADSGLKLIAEKDAFHVLGPQSKLISRSVLISRLTPNGSLDLIITVKIFGPGSVGSGRKLIISNHNDEVVKLNSKLLESGSYSDFNIIVQQQNFQVHRNILAAASPVFDKMFSVDMIESKSGRCEIKHIKPQIFQHLMDFIYVGKVPADISDVAKELFEAAHYYEIEKLKEICKQELPTNLTIENAMETYSWAWDYDLEELKVAAWTIIKK